MMALGQAFPAGHPSLHTILLAVGACGMWKVFCDSGKWCSAPFPRKSNCPLVFHLCMCAHSKEEPGKHHLTLMGTEQGDAMQPHQDPTGPPGWPGGTWSRKQRVSWKKLWGLLVSKIVLSRRRLLWWARWPFCDWGAAVKLLWQLNVKPWPHSWGSSVVRSQLLQQKCPCCYIPLWSLLYSFPKCPIQCPVATTAPAVSREGQHSRANEMSIFLLPTWKGS